jgi:hypothetical protein
MLEELWTQTFQSERFTLSMRRTTSFGDVAGDDEQASLLPLTQSRANGRWEWLSLDK